MEFKFIDNSDPFIIEVIKLGKKNSATLGLMPKDVYIEQARKKCLVIAFEGSVLCGFCLFRLAETKSRIGITQVCVAPSARRRGIAKLLLNQVRNKFNLLAKGMLVSCREDYKEARQLWNSYGFVIKKRVRSRSIQEKYLLKLWYNFDQKDLFSIEANPNDLRVVLDLNILIKLNEDKDLDEIQQLLSDWLTDEVDYCYAKETLNEIHRDKDFRRTNNTLQFINSFQELSCNPVESQQFHTILEELHPGATENHISDRKQLAECKASNISYFITMDEELIAHRDAIYEKLGISILRPGEFILEIDELKNRRLYEPIRLQGARYEVKRVSSHELLPAIDHFLNKESGERKAEFQMLVTSSSADKKASTLQMILSPENDPTALYCFKIGTESIDVIFLRVKKAAISNTLFSQILVKAIHEAGVHGKPRIKILEKNLSIEQNQILRNHGFDLTTSGWVKLSLTGLHDSKSLLSSNLLIKSHPELSNTISLLAAHTDPEIRDKLKLTIERKLWPLKLSDLSIPTFIVPIKPLWAAQLFDYLSSNESLFGAVPDLSWSRENVYYRSHRPNVESFPARILWYASEEKGFSRTKAIVGCSYLNKVIVGEAKQLFSTYRRFGIYKWPEIFNLAKGDVHRPIKVLQFSDTEVFEKTVSFATTNAVLLSENYKKQTFVSPVKVNHLIFNKIYSLAKGNS